VGASVFWSANPPTSTEEVVYSDADGVQLQVRCNSFGNRSLALLAPSGARYTVMYPNQGANFPIYVADDTFRSLASPLSLGGAVIDVVVVAGDGSWTKSIRGLSTGVCGFTGLVTSPG
jgi:hypothetical protein